MNDPFGILAGVKGAFSSPIKLVVALRCTLDYVLVMMRDKITVYKNLHTLTLVRGERMLVTEL